MARVFYEVEATFKDEAVARAWVAWMLGEHIADVVRAGAASGRIIRLRDGALRFAAHYEFSDRPAYDRYIREDAPRLREEAVRRFDLRDVVYHRRDGDVVDAPI